MPHLKRMCLVGVLVALLSGCQSVSDQAASKAHDSCLSFKLSLGMMGSAQAETSYKILVLGGTEAADAAKGDSKYDQLAIDYARVEQESAQSNDASAASARMLVQQDCAAVGVSI